MGRRVAFDRLDEYGMMNGIRPELRPEAVIFDYGHTLGYEWEFNALRGMAAMLEHAVGNPLGVTAEQLAAKNAEMFSHLDNVIHPNFIELHHQIYLRALFEPLRLEFDVSYLALESILWDAAGPAKPMPGAVELIDHLNENGYRTGVISNLTFSGEALTKRLNDILPRNRFEFVIASSDYGWRKPKSPMFGAALAKLGVSAERVWYCGDSAEADVIGSAGAGITPVWVDSDIECYYRDRSREKKPDCGYIYAKSLSEVAVLLGQCGGDGKLTGGKR